MREDGGEEEVNVMDEDEIVSEREMKTRRQMILLRFQLDITVCFYSLFI